MERIIDEKQEPNGCHFKFSKKVFEFVCSLDGKKITTDPIPEIKEENHYLINEEYNVDTIDEKSQIEDFENLDNTILDFSESNPFGDAGKES